MISRVRPFASGSRMRSGGELQAMCLRRKREEKALKGGRGKGGDGEWACCYQQSGVGF